ncbi:hypothetical protein EOM82_06695 [bacterium]|nr:hypothetical protein [bacterium]
MEKKLNGNKYFLAGLLTFAAVLIFVYLIVLGANFFVSTQAARAADIESPTIDTQPISFSGIYDGTDKELSISASHVDETVTLVYTWYAKLTGQSEFSQVGEGSTYVFDGFYDNGSYYCEIVAIDTENSQSDHVLSDEVTVNMYKRPLYATINNAESFYGEEFSELSYYLTGGELVNGDTLSDVGIVLTKQAGNSAGSYQISGAYNSENYAVFFIKGTYTIKPKNIRIVIANKTSVYGEPLQDLAYYLFEGDTLAGEDTLSGLNITLAKTAGTGAGRYPIIGDYDNGNYNISFIPGEYNIAKRSLMVGFENYDELIYSGEIQSIECFVLGSPLLNDIVTVSLQYNKTPKNAGIYQAKAILSNNNYAIIGGDTKLFVIEKKPLKIALKDTVINIGDTPEFTYQYVGFVEGEDEKVLIKLPTVIEENWDVGDYELTPLGAEANNYEFEYVKGLLRINKKEMTPSGGLNAKARGSFSPDAAITVAESSAAVFSKLGSIVAAEYDIAIDGEFYGDTYKIVIEGLTLNSIFMRAVIVDAEGKMNTLRHFEYKDGILTVETGSQGTLVIYNDYLPVGIVGIVIILVIVIMLIFIAKDKARYARARKQAEAAVAEAEYYRRISEN